MQSSSHPRPQAPAYAEKTNSYNEPTECVTDDKVKSSGATVTELVADFAASTTYDDIPSAALSEAKRLLLDTVGVTLAAAPATGAQALVDYIRSEGAEPTSTVVGTRVKSSPGLAAFANGTMAHMLEYDETAISSHSHVSCALVPALLALGEQRDSSGRELLTAYVVGWEVAATLGRAVRDGIYEQGWHPVGTIGTVASAVACARLLSLEEGAIRTAIGIAASLGAGLKSNSGTDAKPMHAGNAARHGVVAAELAQRGLTASHSVLEGDGGYLQSLVGGAAIVEPPPHESWDILTGAAYKLHPCVGISHPAIDAAIELRRDAVPDVDEIARIDLHVPAFMTGPFFESEPSTALEAKFSIEYAVAAALVDGRVGLAQFTEDAIRRPDVRRLMRLVQFRPTDEPPDRAEKLVSAAMASPQTVAITLRDGTTHARTCTFWRGRPENPATTSELVAKFHECASLVLGKEARDRVVTLCAAFDDLESVRPFASSLASA